MRRAFLFFIVLVVYAVAAMSESAPDPTIKEALSYHIKHDGFIFYVLATSFNGVCKVTVKRHTASGLSEKTAQMDAATFAKLMDGVANIPAITLAPYTDDSVDVDPETQHVITTLIQRDGGSKTEMYAVPDKDAPKPFREWLKLLFDAIPKP